MSEGEEKGMWKVRRDVRLVNFDGGGFFFLGGSGSVLRIQWKVGVCRVDDEERKLRRRERVEGVR